jgi:hypothetical protein
MEKKKFIIQDWAGNHLFKDKKFDSFEDGWEFIYENVDNSVYEQTNKEDDNAYQDYFVIEQKNKG